VVQAAWKIDRKARFLACWVVLISTVIHEHQELLTWSGRAIVEGKKGAIPEHLPPILQRLNMHPEEYLAYIRKPRSGFAHALGALDKLKEYAEYFEKAFVKGQTAAAALFSPGR